MGEILPKKINAMGSSIYPTSISESEILPQKNCINQVTIFPDRVEEMSVKTQKNNKSIVMALAVMLVCVVVIYGGSYISFKRAFEDDWSRVESNDGSYYELKLEIEDGKIDYRFESWLLDSTIASHQYIVIAPGKVVIDNDWDDIINVEIEDDMMIMEPAITSIDSREYWFK